MPVFLNPKYRGRERRLGLDWPRAETFPPAHRASEWLHIGLVNNMADAALGSTERSFLQLLQAAAGNDVHVHFTLYALPEVERMPVGQRRVGSYYFDIQQLWDLPADQRPDGLIVTGREPLTNDLRREVYWPSMERLVHWTRTTGCSTVWSCLAAHAAVLAAHDVPRVRQATKCFGILDCHAAEPHPLLSGIEQSLRVPHSRWNGLDADQLRQHGYRILSLTSDGEVDTFIDETHGLSVYFQGHPEYETGTLLAEYRRDVGRFCRGESDRYPTLPGNYFDPRTAEALQSLAERVTPATLDTHLAEVSAVLSLATINNRWRSSAITLYRNWLHALVRQP